MVQNTLRYCQIEKIGNVTLTLVWTFLALQSMHHKHFQLAIARLEA